MQTLSADPLYLGRQPIVDRKQNLAGFQLEVRQGNTPPRDKAPEATANLLQFAFGEIGADAVLGRHKGAISLTPSMALHGFLDELPRERLMLNLMPGESVTPDVYRRLQMLRNGGFSLAMDARMLTAGGGRELLPLAELITLDVHDLAAANLANAVRGLKPAGRRLLATGVRSAPLARSCFEQGFDYVQGLHFIRPELQPGRRLDHGQMGLMRLLGMAMADTDLPVLVDAVKHYPDIALQLLRLANSAALGAKGPISDIHHAINHMGRLHLQRWLQVLAFSTGGTPGVEYPSPLLIHAATRGKLMELIARDLLNGDRTRQEQAFLTGMVSLMGAQFGIELAELLQDLPVQECVRSALLEREGELGILLFAAESLEEPDLVDMQFFLEGVGAVDLDRLAPLQVDAMRWANSLDTRAADTPAKL